MKKLAFIISVVIGFVVTYPTYAAEGAMNFFVKPLPSSKQNSENNKVGYYDLILKKAEKENIKIEVSNGSNKDLEVDISVNTAKTNSNGLVEYGKSDLLVSKSLKYKVEDYIKAPKSIKLKAKESKVVNFEVTSPKEDAPGIMAGGLTFKEKEKPSDSKGKEEVNNRQGVAIENQYAYVIGFLLRQSSEKVVPNLNISDVNAGLFNGHIAILTKIENEKSSFVNTMKVDAKVRKRSRDKVLYSKMVENMQMAPKTIMEFPLELENQSVKPGKYTLDMVIFSFKDEKGKYKDEKGQLYRYKWTFSKDFEVSKDSAYDINSDSVDNIGTSWWIYAILCGLLVLILILFSIWKRKKKEDEQNN